MCYPVKCGTCSKTSWAGCGKHVPSVYANVPAGQACLCKAWPGVNLPKQTTTTNDAKTSTATTATATPAVATK